MMLLFMGENSMNVDTGDYSEIENFNYEIILNYDLTYPPSVTWTKDIRNHKWLVKHLREFILVHKKVEKQALLNVNQDFFMFNYLIPKIKSNTVKTSLGRSDWIEAMRVGLNECKRNNV